MSDVATLNSLIKDVSDLGGSIKNVEVDEDERGLILRVPRTDGLFDITIPEHLHLNPEDFDDEQGYISEKVDMPEPVCAFWNTYFVLRFVRRLRPRGDYRHPAGRCLLARRTG